MRAETGNMRFGDDWTGVFIRGDTAFAYRMCLQRALGQGKDLDRLDRLTVSMMQGLLDLLKRCDEHESGPGKRPEAQMAELIGDNHESTTELHD